MKNLFVFIVLLQHLPTNSQRLEGVLFDSISREKLQYANLAFKGKEIGTFSDKEGAYSLDLSRASDNDSLIISLIGYQSKNIALVNYLVNKTSVLNVSLVPTIELLDEVIVHGKKEAYENKIHNLKTGKRKTMFPISVPFGYETAILLKNEKGKKGKLVALSVKLKNANKKDFISHQTYFRLSFYSVDEFGYPDRAISYENLILKPEKDVAEYQVNLIDENITFYENGIFLGIQTVKPDNVELSNGMYLTTPNIIYTHSLDKLTFTRFGPNKWYKNNRGSFFKQKYYEVPFIKFKTVYIRE